MNIALPDGTAVDIVAPDWYLIDGEWHHCASDGQFAYVDGVRQNAVMNIEEVLLWRQRARPT